jgi:dihydrofolate reductase
MRRIRYGVGMSLNGFIADRHGRTDFPVSDSTYDPAPFFASIDSVIMGRLTYEGAVRQGMRAYASLRNYVVSRTLSTADYPEVTILRDTRAVAELRRASGKDIWLCGGGVLLASLLAAGLVDTVELGVSPTLLGGKGTPMLGLARRLPPAVALDLTHHRALPSGLLVLEYAVRKTAQGAAEPRRVRGARA